MPSHRQFDKSLRQEVKSRDRNRSAKSRLHTVIKKVNTASSQEDAREALRNAVSTIDSIARRGIIKKTTAARKKSRLYKFVSKIN